MLKALKGIRADGDLAVGARLVIVDVILRHPVEFGRVDLNSFGIVRDISIEDRLCDLVDGALCRRER